MFVSAVYGFLTARSLEKLVSMSLSICVRKLILTVYHGYISHDNIHEIITWKCPIQTVWLAYK